MDINSFLDYVRADCKKHKVKLNLSNKNHVMTGGIKCNGFFDGESKVLAVACGQPLNQWIKILVHEYGHMTQWKDQCKEWIASEEGNPSAEIIIDTWLSHRIELNPKQLIDWGSRCRNVELDCEKRVVKMIKKFSLPIDIKDYIKKANAYVFFWTYLRRIRKWYTIGHEPYNNKELVASMPAHFRNNYDKLPKNFRDLYLNYLDK